eukprot:scaffold122959_cov71-Phaeocystis_antarctica.AAC.1
MAACSHCGPPREAASACALSMRPMPRRTAAASVRLPGHREPRRDGAHHRARTGETVARRRRRHARRGELSRPPLLFRRRMRLLGRLRRIARLLIPAAQLRAERLPLGVGQQQAGKQSVVCDHPALVARLQGQQGCEE